MSLYKSFSSLGCKTDKKIETFENFEENMHMDYNKKMGIISRNPIVCVKVYSDNCGACVRAKPVYNKLIEEYHNKGCTLIKQSIDSYDNNKEPVLQGYPTFHIYYKGKLHSNVLGADIPALQNKLDNLVLLHNKNNGREGFVENLETFNPTTQLVRDYPTQLPTTNNKNIINLFDNNKTNIVAAGGTGGSSSSVKNIVAAGGTGGSSVKNIVAAGGTGGSSGSSVKNIVAAGGTNSSSSVNNRFSVISGEINKNTPDFSNQEQGVLNDTLSKPIKKQPTIFKNVLLCFMIYSTPDDTMNTMNSYEVNYSKNLHEIYDKLYVNITVNAKKALLFKQNAKSYMSIPSINKLKFRKFPAYVFVYNGKLLDIFYDQDKLVDKLQELIKMTLSEIKTLDYTNCENNYDCVNNACAVESSANDSKKICCPNGMTEHAEIKSTGKNSYTIIKKNYCAKSLRTGDVCLNDTQCESLRCDDVINSNNRGRTTRKGLCKPRERLGQQCSGSNNCVNNACGRETGGSTKNICCPNGMGIVKYDNYDYCKGLKNGSDCLIDEQCDSFRCDGVVKKYNPKTGKSEITQKGVCKPKEQLGQPCSGGVNNCLNGHCCRLGDSSSPLICHPLDMKYTNDKKSGYVPMCYPPEKYLNGNVCRSDTQCRSNICKGNKNGGRDGKCDKYML